MSAEPNCSSVLIHGKTEQEARNPCLKVHCEINLAFQVHSVSKKRILCKKRYLLNYKHQLFGDIIGEITSQGSKIISRESKSLEFGCLEFSGVQ